MQVFGTFLKKNIHDHNDGESAGAPGYHYDMLHDSVRNKEYRSALEKVVQEDDFVLDIGSGSGLLALLAAKYTNCQHVFTCEADPSLASCARLIVEANNCQEKVSVIGPKFSYDLRVAYDADIPCKADVIVTEIFDSILLGEGILPTMDHAVENLLADGGKVIPAGATIYVCPIESQYLTQQVRLFQKDSNRITGYTKENITYKPLQIHAGHLLKNGLVKLLAKPQELFRFDFSKPKKFNKVFHSITIETGGTVDGFLLWWSLDLAEGHTIDTSPAIESSIPQRDHWRQFFCILSSSLVVHARDIIGVHAQHFEETVVLAAQKDVLDLLLDPKADTVLIPKEPPFHCNACIHFNDSGQGKENFRSRSVQLLNGYHGLVVAIGDGILGKQILNELDVLNPVLYLHYSERCSAKLKELYGAKASEMHYDLEIRIEQNGIPFYPKEDIISKIEEFSDKVKASNDCLLVLAEPFYYDMRAPGSKFWLLDEFIRYSRTVEMLKEKYAQVLEIPASCKLFVQAITCPNLSKTKRPIFDVEGIDLQLFNSAASRPPGISVIDLQPWRDDIAWLGEAIELCELKVSDFHDGMHIAITRSWDSGKPTGCDALVFWCAICDIDGKPLFSNECGTSEGLNQAVFFFQVPDPRPKIDIVLTVKDASSEGSNQNFANNMRGRTFAAIDII